MSATLQESGRIGLAIAVASQPLHLAWGRGSPAWDSTPESPPGNANALTDEIGRRLGFTKNAVIGKVHRLGLPKRRPSAKEEDEPVDVVRLDSLSSDMCSWPVGNPSDEGFHFCGGPKVPGKPYCAKHCAVAYIKPAKIRGNG